MKIWSNCRSGVGTLTINNKALRSRITWSHNLKLRAGSIADGNGDLWPAVEYGPAKGFGSGKRGSTPRQQPEDAPPPTPAARDRSPAARPPRQPSAQDSYGRPRKVPGRGRQADRLQRTSPSSGRGTSNGSGKGDVPDGADRVNGLHAQVLSATRWSSLTDLLTQSQSSRTHSAAASSNDGAGPSTGSNDTGASTISTSISAPPAAAPTAVADASEGGHLTESALLLVLWRIVCAQLRILAEQRHHNLRPGLQSLPRPLPAPPPLTAPLSLGEDPWQQQLWSGQPPGASDPWDLQSNGSFMALAGLGGTPLTRRFPASPFSSGTGFRGEGTGGKLWGVAGPATPPAPLVGSSVARHRCLEALEAAARRLAPGMSPRGLVVGLQLLGYWAATMSEGVDTRGLGSGEVWRLAEPFLAAAAAAASTSQWVPADLLAMVAALPPLHRFCNKATPGSSGRDMRRSKSKAKGNSDNVNDGRGSSPPPVTHEVLAAALSTLTRGADMVIPSPSELTVCIAAAAACGYAPPPSWLALLRSELRNQVFLLTAPQGAVILTSLARLPSPPPPPRGQGERRKGPAEGGAEEATGLTAAADEVNWEQEEVATLWAEVQGKAAALDLAGRVAALLELSRYVEAGLLLPTPATSRALLGSQHPQLAAQLQQYHHQEHQEQLFATGGAAVGHGSGSGATGRGSSPVRHLTTALLGQLAPQLPECSGEQLTAVLVAAARLYEYEHDSSDHAVGVTATTQAVAGAAKVSGLDSQQEQHVGALPILEPLARSLLRHVRSSSLSLPHLGACVAALVTLLTVAATSPTAVKRRPTVTQAAAPTPAAPAALAALLLEVPEEVLRCVLPTALGRNEVGFGRRARAAEPAATAVGALGPEDLAWLLPLETLVVAMEDHLAPRLPLLQQVLLNKAQEPQEDAARGAAGPPSEGPQERRFAAGARGLAARAMSGIMSNLKQLSVAQLLQLAAASQHPQTSGLFSTEARRDVLLAILNSPLPSATAAAAATTSASIPRPSAPSPLQSPTAAELAAVVPAIVRSLPPEVLVTVLCAAARRCTACADGHDADGQPQGQQEQAASPLRRQQRQRQRHLPPDPIAVAVLSAALAQLLDLALPESQPGFMDVPRRPATSVLSTEQWCNALAAVAQAAHALVQGASGIAPGTFGGDMDMATPAAIKPATLLQLLKALQPIWPTMRPSQAVAAYTHLVDLHDTMQVLFPSSAAVRKPGDGASGGAATATGGEPPPTSRTNNPGGAGSAATAATPGTEDWYVVQRAVAAAAAGLTARELAAMVTAAARLAAVAPLCDEWMEALTQVLLSPPPAPAPLAGGLAALDAVTALNLLRGCVELKAVAAEQDSVMLPVLPLLEQLGTALLRQSTAASAATPVVPQGAVAPSPGGGTEDQSGTVAAAAAATAATPTPPEPAVSCSDICRLLPRLSLVATDPPLAAVVGTSALPLLVYLQQQGFVGARLGDLLAALTGMSRLLLRPEPAWAAALCQATTPVLLNPATALPDLATLAHAMAQAWLVPTPDWHSALLAATMERMVRGGGGSATSRKDQAMEQLLWAVVMWSRLSAAGATGGKRLQVPGLWLDQLAAASVPLLAGAQPQVLASMPYLFNALGHDPGPDFIAALLQRCTATIQAFTGPQLSRLAYGLAGLGYQPEDPWVTALQLAAANALHDCDGHELAELLEGMLLLEERRDVASLGEIEDSGGAEDEEQELGPEELQGRSNDLNLDTDLDSESDSDSDLELDSQLSGFGTDLDWELLLDPDLDLPSMELFLMAFWDASAALLSADAVLLSEAVARQLRRQDLQMVERLKVEFRERTTDPQTGPFWRYWTEQVPFLDPSLVAPDEVVQGELAALSMPLFDGAATDSGSQQHLQRFLVWAALRHGTLPTPLPEGVSPWAGHLAARCVELLSGPRAAKALEAPPEAAAGAAAGAATEPPPSAQRHLQRSGAAIRVAPPAEWVSILLLSEANAMLLGGEVWSRRQQLLQASQAAITWAAPPLAEWGEAFLRASRTAFLGGNTNARGDGGDGGGAGDEAPTTAAAAAATERGATTGPGLTEASGGGGERVGSPGGGNADTHGEVSNAACPREDPAAPATAPAVAEPLELRELLQLLMAVLTLDLEPGASWLAAAEAASLPLLRICQAEEAVALALALQRLGHQPGREWAEALLAATRATTTAKNSMSSISVAALLVCLGDLRIRPTDAWMDDALAALYGRDDELPGSLRARLLSAFAALEVQPSSGWLAPVVDGFWSNLEELLSGHDVTPLVDGLAAVSALDLPVKQSQLSTLLGLLSRRLGLETGTTGVGIGDAGTGAVSSAASAIAADVARVLICLAGMRRATPSRSNRNTLDALYRAVAERLPVSGPLTAQLLDSWDKLVPV